MWFQCRDARFQASSKNAKEKRKVNELEAVHITYLVFYVVVKDILMPYLAGNPIRIGLVVPKIQVIKCFVKQQRTKDILPFDLLYLKINISCKFRLVLLDNITYRHFGPVHVTNVLPTRILFWYIRWTCNLYQLFIDVIIGVCMMLSEKY